MIYLSLVRHPLQPLLAFSPRFFMNVGPLIHSLVYHFKSLHLFTISAIILGNSGALASGSIHSE